MADSTAETAAQYPDTPEGKQARWALEISAAKENQKDYWTDGDRVISEFLGQGKSSRLNLYYSDVMTKDATLSGVPKIRAKRRYADANDDVARVSAEMLERLLNTDIERDSDGFRRSLRNAKGDWLKPGLGQLRFRYVVETEERETPAQHDEAGNELAPAYTEEVKVHEDVETDYVHWRDFLWSPARVWDEVTWVAYRIEMTREALVERFGEDLGNRIPLTRGATNSTDQRDEAVKRTWGRAEIWEIWCKYDRMVRWFCEGMPHLLDEKPDPLGLPGFFPSPEPLAANVTTSKWMPRPTFFLVEKLYEQAHDLTGRIQHLITMIKVSGAYDETNEGLASILKAAEGTIVPVKNWAASMGQGINGAIQFLPIRDMVEVLTQLVLNLQEIKRQIYEITGQSDIMRGMAAQKATATEQRIKARFGSTRIQSEQDELARFASDAQKIRAFIIAKMFDPETIIQRSNIGMTETVDAPPAPPMPGMPPQPPRTVPNMPLIQQAVALLKSDVSQFRIEVDSDSLSMTDFDAVRQERTEFLQAMTMYLAEVAKIAPVAPTAIPYLLELGKHSLAAFPGGQVLEGVFDRMIDAAKQPPPPKPPPPPDPRMVATQVKAQTDIATSKMDLQGKAMDMQAKQAEHMARMQEIRAETVRDMMDTAPVPDFGAPV